MPRYRRQRESQPNPEAENVRAYPRVHIRPRPHSPRTPTAQDYEESPRPATATSPHNPITPTHAHSSAQGHGPTQGELWRCWTHTQLWERRKWARAEPSLEGLVHRPRKGSAENRRLQPAEGWMPQAAWEAMLADALHPQGVHPRNLPAPQDHPDVRRCLRETLQDTRREGTRLWDITESPTPRTHTPSPPHKRQRTDTGSTHSTQEPRAPHSTTRLTPQPAAPPPDPNTQPPTAAGRHATPRPEDTKQTGSRRTPTHTPTGTATPNGAEPKPTAVETASPSQSPNTSQTQAAPRNR